MSTAPAPKSLNDFKSFETSYVQDTVESILSRTNRKTAVGAGLALSAKLPLAITL
jgi:hypothetical protein